MSRRRPPARAALACALLLGASLAPAAPRSDLPLFPGADPKPKTEHVFTYPLPEALGAARALLEAHDLDVEPYFGPSGGAPGRP